jgi:hypothetical protein
MQPFKWELKQQPGAMSPARGGFRKDDPNQQILADEEIYDEYGGERHDELNVFFLSTILHKLHHRFGNCNKTWTQSPQQWLNVCFMLLWLSA